MNLSWLCECIWFLNSTFMFKVYRSVYIFETCYAKKYAGWGLIANYANCGSFSLCFILFLLIGSFRDTFSHVYIFPYFGLKLKNRLDIFVEYGCSLFNQNPKLKGTHCNYFDVSRGLKVSWYTKISILCSSMFHKTYTDPLL